MVIFNGVCDEHAVHSGSGVMVECELKDPGLCVQSAV